MPSDVDIKSHSRYQAWTTFYIKHRCDVTTAMLLTNQNTTILANQLSFRQEKFICHDNHGPRVIGENNMSW